jgi:hypothetical protein
MFPTSRMRNQGYNASSMDYHSPIRIGLSLDEPKTLEDTIRKAK